MQIVLNLANHLDTTRTKKSLNIDKSILTPLNIKTANKSGRTEFHTFAQSLT